MESWRVDWKMTGRAWITGASGFVGRHLVRHLAHTGWRVQSARLRPGALDASSAPAPSPGDVVFHLGGMAHRSRRAERDLYMATNCELTLALYAQASRAGARGFVFVSTSKVLGERVVEPAGIDAPRQPKGPYAESKALAEERLLAACVRTALPLAIVRPPLVYGPGVAANFGKLLHCLALGLPLPLANARSRRSLVSAGNLVHALAAVGTGLAAANKPDGQIWHVSDGCDVDVATLCRLLARKLGREARLWPLPRPFFQAAGIVPASLLASLFEPFRLDDGSLRRELGWSPPQSFDLALDETVRWFQGRP